MIALVLIGASGCSSGRTTHPPPPTFGSDTSADTAGTTSPTTGGPDARAFVAPSVVLTDPDRLVGTFVYLVPAHNGDPGVILLPTISESWFGDGDIVMVPLSGVQPRGTRPLEEAWDGVGVLRAAAIRDGVANAGDVNGDGHLDLWLNDRLVAGPLLGRDVNWDTEPFLATLDGEVGVMGDFDANGDGALDVLTMPWRANQAFVRYGPLSGAIPSARYGVADPATYSSFGESLGCDVYPSAAWLRDQLGPGHDAISVGMDLEICNNDTFIWDPFVPPGTHRTYDEAIAVFASFSSYLNMAVYDPGDVDGDGHPDVLFEWGDSAQIAPGPVAGIYDPLLNFGFTEQEVNGEPRRAMGDVNGDGAREILGRWSWTPTEGYDRRPWVLMCSPFTLPLDLSTGLVLFERYSPAFALGLDSVDLDGDGLDDLVDARSDEPYAGLYIWYGSDLAAACAAQSSVE